MLTISAATAEMGRVLATHIEEDRLLRTGKLRHPGHPGYPDKSVEDFEIQRKAATVTFVGTGLSVDIRRHRR
jgi:hypothetical protein